MTEARENDLERWLGKERLVCVTTGPRQGVDALRRWMVARLEAGEGTDGPGSLPQIVVVVPSRALADNLSRHILSDPRCSLGVSFLTLHGLAHQVVLAAGGREGSSAALDLLVSRAVEHLPGVAHKLGKYRDVDRVLSQTVRDFVHAGLDIDNHAMVEVLAESLKKMEARGMDVTLAHGIVDAALWVLQKAQREGLVLSQQLLARAASLLRGTGDPADSGRKSNGSGHGDALLPPGDSFVLYGFADVTGLGLDFLQELAARRPTTLFVDLPLDPADREDEHVRAGRHWLVELDKRPSWRFAARFLLGMHGSLRGGLSEDSLVFIGSKDEDPALHVKEVWKASDPHGEMAAVAAEVRRLLDRGVAPEDIAVVFRDSSSLALDLRARFDALAVPYSSPSGSGFGPASPRFRPLAGLARMLEEGPDTSLDLWAQLLVQSGGMEPGEVRRLVLATRQLGLARLSDVSDLDEAYWEKTPRRFKILASSFLREEGNFQEDAGEQGDDQGVGASREARGGGKETEPGRAADRGLDQVPRADVRRFVDRAAEVAAWLQRIGAEAQEQGGKEGWDVRLGEFVEFVRELLRRRRGEPTEAETILLQEVDDLLRNLLPPNTVVTWREFAVLAGRRLASAGREPFGGRGGGVQVLSVTQARGCRFRHLFVPGLNHGIFPRPVSEDPLLPDSVRAGLRDALAGLPVKSSGHDEELYLFCQLLGAADELILSWHGASTDGTVAVRSALLERLGPVDQDRNLPSALALPDFGASTAADGDASAQAEPPALADPCVPRTERDLALAWARSLQRLPRAEKTLERLSGPLRILLDAQQAAGLMAEGIDPSAVARARAAVFREQAGLVAQDLGPYLGFVGSVAAWLESRGAPKRDWWATHAEAFAKCPWQWFLGRVLKLEPPLDPLAMDLDWNALMIGNAFHRAAERLVRRVMKFEQELDGRRRHGETLDACVGRTPVSLPKPSEEELGEVALEAAREVLVEYGPVLEPLAHPLAQDVIRHMEIALEEDWVQGPPQVLGVEAEGVWKLPDGREIRFKADRVDRLGDFFLLTDYKTGEAPNRKASPQPEKQLTLARQAKFVQGVAYASSLPKALGRYLYVKLDGPNKRSHVVAGEYIPRFSEDDALDRLSSALRFDDGLSDVTRDAVTLCFETWEGGWAPPNIKKGEYGHCSRCDFQEACAWALSGAERRIDAWDREGDAAVAGPRRFFSFVVQGRDPEPDESGEKGGGSGNTKGGKRGSRSKRGKGGKKSNEGKGEVRS